MDSMQVVGLVLMYVVALGVSLLITFWIIRTAILSALAEDRRRVARAQVPAGTTYGATGTHWLEGDGR